MSLTNRRRCLASDAPLTNKAGMEHRRPPFIGWHGRTTPESLSTLDEPSLCVFHVTGVFQTHEVHITCGNKRVNHVKCRHRHVQAPPLFDVDDRHCLQFMGVCALLNGVKCLIHGDELVKSVRATTTVTLLA